MGTHVAMIPPEPWDEFYQLGAQHARTGAFTSAWDAFELVLRTEQTPRSFYAEGADKAALARAFETGFNTTLANEDIGVKPELKLDKLGGLPLDIVEKLRGIRASLVTFDNELAELQRLTEMWRIAEEFKKGRKE